MHLGQRGYVIPRPHPTLVTRRVLVMERLDGFNFDDVAAMQDAGVDTHAVVRTGMIGFMEGALIEGVFHGDLHGGNLFVMPDGKVALLDFGITGRMDDLKRRAFLRLMLGATTNDVRVQLAALRDLGALPMDTDLEAVITDLGLEGPGIDPTQLTPDEMIHEIQRIVKLLLGYGARMPKELMLYVKNLVFLDGAIARLAPDLDLFAEIANITMYFAQTHGEKLFADVGVDAVVVRDRPGRDEEQLRRRSRHRAADLPGAAGATGAHPQPVREARHRLSPRSGEDDLPVGTLDAQDPLEAHAHGAVGDRPHPRGRCWHRRTG